MKNLYFIRSTGGIVSWEYYERKTEVVIFGDLDGYRYVIESIDAARRYAKTIYLEQIDATSNSMQVAITVPYNLASIDKQLRVIERPVIVNGTLNMELAFFGNDAGYQYLSDTFSEITENTRQDVGDHYHISDSTEAFVVKSSVSLNIRSPLVLWSKENLEHWVDFIYKRQLTYLPPDIDYMIHDMSLQEYEEIRANMNEKYMP